LTLLRQTIITTEKRVKAQTKPLCFVCGISADAIELRINKTVLMPVCFGCNGTEAEKSKEDELLEGLADGLVCGCI
jgi:hypothetical protein